MGGGWRQAVGYCLGFLALHLVLGAVIPLIGDEAYYRLWASGLDWDYYDHPPIIAGMIRAGIAVFGDGPFGVRVVALLAMAGASLCVADMARTCGASPGRAVVYFNLSVLVVSVGGFATPDAPSTLFWLLATMAALRAVQGQSPGVWGLGLWGPGVRVLAWWGLAGLAAGLGIMSKFTNLFLGVGFVGWLVFSAQGRASLRGVGPYLALIAAVAPVVPLILWNVAHDGLGFERQFGRIAAGAYSVRHVAEYLALLVLLPGPVLGGLALRGVVRGHGLLLWSMGPVLAYFAYHALHAQVQANWLIVVSGGVAVLAALAVQGMAPLWHRLAVGSAAVLALGGMGLAFNPFAAMGTADNPPNQTRGWPDMLAQIPDTGWIATTDYALTGQLYARLPGRQVWAVTELYRYGFRGSFPAELCNAPGWLIEKAGTAPAQIFDQQGPVVVLNRVFGDTVLRSYHLRQVRGVRLAGLCP